MDPRLNLNLLKSVEEALDDIVDGIKLGINTLNDIIDDTESTMKVVINDFVDAFEELPEKVSK